MDHLIGIDIGTSSVKVLACTAAGEVLARTSRSYPMLAPRPGWREQDADHIARSVAEAAREMAGRMPGRPAAISWSSAMHSLLAVDDQGAPLGNCLIWADQRSWLQARRLRQSDEGYALYAATGTPIHPMSPLCKLLWLRDEKPELFRQAHRFVTIKSYVLFRWLGRFLIDYSDASSCGLFDLQGLHWHAPALELAGITADRLPELIPPTHRIDPTVRSPETGLPPAWQGAPVVIGASDGCLANLGSQVMSEGAAALSIGTSGAIRVRRPVPALDPEGRLFCYFLDDGHYICGGAVNSGAYLLQWFGNQFGEGKSTETLLAAAAATPPGAEGLLCLPYLLGERAPVWDSRARGAFVGITDRHTPAHLLRALLEGICFNLREVGELLEQQSAGIEVLYASGGFTQSPFWVQLLADIFGKPIVIDENEDASAIGAVMLALRSLGYIGALTEAAPYARRGRRFEPDDAGRNVYERLFRLFRGLYPHLRETFEALRDLEGS